MSILRIGIITIDKVPAKGSKAKPANIWLSATSAWLAHQPSQPKSGGQSSKFLEVALQRFWFSDLQQDTPCSKLYFIILFFRFHHIFSWNLNTRFILLQYLLYQIFGFNWIYSIWKYLLNWCEKRRSTKIIGLVIRLRIVGKILENFKTVYTVLRLTICCSHNLP